MAKMDDAIFSACCPSRPILDQITDRWSMLIVAALDAKPLRFNAIKRRLEGVTQKALTQALRRLERNGLVARRVIPVSPVGVEYSITPLGRSLQPPFAVLYAWTVDNLALIAEAQAEFDRRAGDAAQGKMDPQDRTGLELGA